MAKILFCTGEGIGNVIQTVPVLRTIKEVLGYDIDMWYAFGAFAIPKLIPYVDKWYSGRSITNANFSGYKGIVSTFWTRDYIKVLSGTKLLNKITKFSFGRSEVDVYMDIARDLGAREKDLLWYGKCIYEPMDEKFDIVISDGYNRFGSANWSVKSYIYHEQLVKLLNKKSMSVCSIGAPNEYIKGTVDKTGLSLLKSGGIIKNSKLLISNDSGMYHYANALGTKNVVIFTATSIDKNYEKRFHKYSEVVCREDLQCRPCQNKQRWRKGCKDWKCRDIDPEVISKIVGGLL